MHRLILILILFGFVIQTNSQLKSKYVQGELLIKVESPFNKITKKEGKVFTDKEWFNKHSEKFEFIEIDPVFKNQDWDMSKYYKIKFPAKYTLDEIIKKLKLEENIIHAWENRIGEFCSNDPYISQQWGLTKIQAQQAWNINSGTSNVILGIVDSGIDLGDPLLSPSPHPDLVGNLWNENNLWGIDIEDENRAPYDITGHGTHVAGIAGAVTNNNIGIAGVAGGGFNNNNGTTILMVKTDVTEYNISQAIEAAVVEGAKILNMSFVFYIKVRAAEESSAPLSGDFPLLRAAIDYALLNDVVLVAAIGNESYDLDPNPVKYFKAYPALYNEVISVAALNPADIKTTYSNYASWCDISSPGGQNVVNNMILSTYPFYLDAVVPYGYTEKNGTSRAAPFVSGTAALIRSYAPNANWEMVRAILKQTTDNIDSVNAGYPWASDIGTGRLNAYKALSLIQNIPQRPTGISLSVNNNHPSISWAQNTEADIKGYNVHVKYEFRNGTNPKFWIYSHYDYFTTSTNFTDNDWFVAGTDKAYYYVQAIDIINNYSPNSTTVSTFGGLGKENYEPLSSIKADNVGIHPNPFNNQATIIVNLAENGHIQLNVYNIQGQLIHKIEKNNCASGVPHTLKWNGTNLHGEAVPSGIYLIKSMNQPALKPIKTILLK